MSGAAQAFSASDAALEGFRLIGRHWRVVLGWSLFNLLATVAMVLVSAVALLVLVFAGGEGGAAGWVGGGVYLAGTLLVTAILACGVYRLMLRPEEPAFLHLRIGPDELRYAALSALWLAVAVAVVLAGVVAGRPLRMVAGGLSALTVVVALGVLVWLFLRTCLAFPASFAERAFRVARGWRTSRGQAGALLGMWLLNLCVVAMIALALWLGLFVLTGMTTGFDDLFASLSAAERIEANPGRYLLQLTLQVLLAPVFMVMVTAPAMAAYRALAKS